MIVLISIFLPVLLISSIALFTIGKRGRTIDDHPVCGGCGFDLTGKPETSTRCPECGQNVSTPDGVRVGNRERRWKLLLAGVVGLAISGIAVACIGAAVATYANPESLKPNWYVLREAESATYTQPMAELLKRESGGKLTNAQRDRFVKRILIIQANRNMLWNAAYGDLVERLHDTGQLNEPTWQAYFKNRIITESGTWRAGHKPIP